MTNSICGASAGQQARASHNACGNDFAKAVQQTAQRQESGTQHCGSQKQASHQTSSQSTQQQGSGHCGATGGKAANTESSHNTGTTDRGAPSKSGSGCTNPSSSAGSAGSTSTASTTTQTTGNSAPQKSGGCRAEAQPKAVPAPATTSTTATTTTTNSTTAATSSTASTSSTATTQSKSATCGATKQATTDTTTTSETSWQQGTDSNDTLAGNSGSDWIDGGAGNDTINGQGGNDELYGGAGNDTINGGAGNDFIAGMCGDDTINAGAGDDWIVSCAGNDTINGGAGWDTVQYLGNQSDYTVTENTGFTSVYNKTTKTTDKLVDVENIVFADSGDTAGTDPITGTDDGDALTGTDGNDTITGGAGKDWINGGGGNDTIDGGDDADSMIGGAGDDIIRGGKGSDTIDGGAGNDSVYLEGMETDYRITKSGNETYVSDLRTGDVDTLVNVENIKYDQQQVNHSWTNDGKSINLDGKYRIDVDGGTTWKVTNLANNQTTRIWGDPHVDLNNDGSTDFDFKENMTFQLADGTKITVATVDSAGKEIKDANGNTSSVSVTKGLTITNNDSAIIVSNVNGTPNIVQTSGGAGIDHATNDGAITVRESNGQWVTADGAKVDQATINAAEAKFDLDKPFAT